MPAIRESLPGYASDAVHVLPAEPVLAASLTPLVGREEELRHILHLLRERNARLLVLTGPGGVGKTRLAIAVAQASAPDFPDGIVLVSLASIRSPEQVLTTLAAALGVREAGHEQLLPAIRETLHHQRKLLVLDNFEHVLDAGPQLTELLVHCPNISILVTSRSVLGVYGEFVYPVPPLQLPSTPDATPQLVESSEAAQLFIQRVRAIRPEFRLTERNARDVARICARLDGLPLAIELAAARVGIFPVSTLAHRLEHVLPVLEGGLRNVPDRQRTMRNAIAWSYDLLSPVEQAVFRRLAVFLGAWSLDDATAVVCAPDDPALDGTDVVDAVASLVDKSLVQRAESTEHERHFTILQTLREFALDRLTEAGEREATEERHAFAMLELARRARSRLTGHEQVFWLDLIESARPDILAAHERFMRTGRPALALELSASVWRFGYTRGYILETLARLEEALAQAADRTVIRAMALNGAGVLANVAGDYARTRAYHQEALEIARELGHKRTMAVALVGLGDLAVLDGDATEAQRCYEEAERLYIDLDDQRGIATAQTNLANLYAALGRLEEAVQLNEAAKRLYAAAGDQRGTAWSVTNIGRLAAEGGDYRRARENLAQAMELYELLGDRSGIAETLEGLALVALGVHDAPRAGRLLGAAEALRAHIAHPVAQIDMPAHERLLAAVRQALGDDLEAARAAGRALPPDEAIALGMAITVPESHATPPPQRTAAGDQAIARYGITARELEVLERLGAGETDKEIAERMYISPRTVQSHVQRLLDKLDVSSRSAAVAKAFRAGILR